MSVKDISTPIKSESDDRLYRTFTIAENNLQVLICSDSKTDKSGAALACNVGSYSDRPEVLGLAHFLEHMLFLGTEKYPDESEFSAAVSSAGGSNNAWTDSEHTVYYFNCASPHLDGILDRFAQFFIAPLFTPSATEREMNAVHSEHQKNIYNDSWRKHEILRQAMDQSHPAARFHTGDLETLKEIPLANGLDIRQIMLDFHSSFYSSNMMRLVVLGKESLDELQEAVVKHFSPIKNKNTTPPSFPVLTLPKGGCVLEAVPTQEKRGLSLTWVLPSEEEYWESDPLSLLSHMLGDESSGSLLSLLKDCDLALALSAGTGYSTSCFSTFNVNIALTPRGVLRIHDILRLVYAYIDLINTSSDDELHRVASESMLIDNMNFRFKAKTSVDNYISSLVTNMYVYSPEEYIRGDEVPSKIDIPTLRKFSNLLTMDNCVIYVSTKDANRDTPLVDVKIFADKEDGYLETVEVPKAYEDSELPVEELNKSYKNKEWSYEKWYKMRFSKYFLDDVNLDYIKQGIIPEKDNVKGKPSDKPLLNLPAPNPFIPTTFDLISSLEEDVSTPEFSEISDYPLRLDEKGDDDVFINSVTDLSSLRHIAQGHHPQPGKRYTPAEVKDMASKLIDVNLLGFDREHVNDHVLAKDKLTPGLVNTILGDVGTPSDPFLPDASLSGESSIVADKESKQTDDERTDDGEHTDDDDECTDGDYTDGEYTDGDYTDDENYDQSDDAHDSNSNRSGKPSPAITAKFSTLDDLFKEDRIANQWLPPTLVPVPIKKSSFPHLNDETSSIAKMPHLPPVELWHKLSTSYGLPNVFVRIQLYFPSTSFSVLSLLASTISEGINESLYGAVVCGVTYSIQNEFDSISIVVHGHRQTVASTVRQIVNNFHNVNADLVNNRRDVLLRSLRSIDTGSATTQANYHASAFLARNIVHHRVKIDEIQRVSVDEVVAASRLVKNACVFVNGNVSESYAIRIAQLAVHSVGCVSLPSTSFRHPGNIRPQGDIYSVWAHGNPDEDQHGIRTLYYLTPPTLQDRARTITLLNDYQRVKNANPDMVEYTPNKYDIISGKVFDKMTNYGTIAYAMMLGQLLDEHFFDQLRTKQQLGYIVYSYVAPGTCGYCLNMFVQTALHPALVEHRIEAYLRKTLRQLVENMTTEQWCAHAAGRHASAISAFNTIQAESTFFWDKIKSRAFDFDISLVVPFLLKHVHRHVFLAYLKSVLYGPQRTKLGVHVVASSSSSSSSPDDNTKVKDDEYTRYRSATVCHEEEIFSLQSMFPVCD